MSCTALNASAAVGEMHVRIVESRKQPIALGVDDAGMRSLPLHDGRFRTHRDKPAVEHGERIGLRLLGIHGPNVRVAHDEVGGWMRIGGRGARSAP